MNSLLPASDSISSLCENCFDRSLPLGYFLNRVISRLQDEVQLDPATMSKFTYEIVDYIRIFEGGWRCFRPDDKEYWIVVAKRIQGLIFHLEGREGFEQLFRRNLEGVVVKRSQMALDYVRKNKAFEELLRLGGEYLQCGKHAQAEAMYAAALSRICHYKNRFMEGRCMSGIKEVYFAWGTPNALIKAMALCNYELRVQGFDRLSNQIGDLKKFYVLRNLEESLYQVLGLSVPQGDQQPFLIGVYYDAISSARNTVSRGLLQQGNFMKKILHQALLANTHCPNQPSDV